MRPYALIDLIAILPFFLAPFLPFNADALRLLRLARLLRILKLGRHLGTAWQEFQQLNQGQTRRATVFALMEPTSRSGQLHRYLDNFIIFWILVSIASTVLESVASISAVMGRELAVLDAIAFTIFFVEYGARWYAAAENPAYQGHRLPRWSHVRSPQAIIDLLAILPFLLERFLPWPMDLRFLRVFRLLRLLKLTRYASGTGTLIKVVRREGPVILAAVFVMLLLVVLTASMGYLFEHEAQPDKFENIPQTIYWAVITLSSVGYGDISPVTPMGRALTVVLSLLGIGIFAIPAGLLASAFTDQLRMDREQLKQQLQDALKHGALDVQAQEWLIAETHRLHLSAEEVQRLKAQAQAQIEQQRQAAHSHRPVLLDPHSHPDLAAAQFRLLVEQLELLHQATDPAVLQRHLPERSAARRVLRALHKSDEHT
jgi:voltage-gated potassium channel Kch